MSLNRSEQYLYDYMQMHKEEGQYWLQKVHSMARAASDVHEAARLLEADLWAYYVERNRSGSKFARENPVKDERRTSMRNLAELLLRLWANLPRKRPDV